VQSESLRYNKKNSLIYVEVYYSENTIFPRQCPFRNRFFSRMETEYKKGLLARTRRSGYRAVRRIYVEKVRNNIYYEGRLAVG